MKNYFNILSILIAVLLMISCERDEIGSFEADAAINFVVNNDSRTYASGYSFLGNESSEYEAEIPVRIIGDSASYDRYFNVTVIEDSLTTATSSQYEILQGIVPSGAFLGKLHLKVLNSTVLDSTEVAVHLQISNSDDFTVGNTEQVDYVFTWTNKVLVPAWTYYRYFFCRHPSSNAYRAFVISTGMTSFTINDYRALGPTGAQVKGTEFGDYIKQYNLEHPGEPMLHDDGPNAGEEIVPIYYTHELYD
ncbi:DUF4843 domain-containing protein [Robertkochia solimangrovi]|uniref:DUF4843 domain-containing protein n=1 Tax=Robertkochia solimangrovi TaxID=2213046 RepID=UPI00118094F9|nr:DUF4843 domain-containing protein [Robertkochia solimangrovi]TRZ45187.1 hypothetical protein DMZ48_05410 [Robertkochia solimangrovi]